MNKTNNQRYRETEQTIRAAVAELLGRGEPLTVRAICQRADINRSSFYLHYRDVYDMMDRLEADMSGEMVAAFTREGTPDVFEGFVNMFTYMAEHAAFYRAWLSSPRRTRPFPFVLPASHAARVQRLRGEIGLKSDAEFNYQEGFFLGGIAEVTRMWLAGGCAESPRELVTMFMGMFSHSKGPWSGWV